MKHNIIKMSLGFVLLLTVITAVFYIRTFIIDKEMNQRENVVALNEIEALVKQSIVQSGEGTLSIELQQSIRSLQNQLMNESVEGENKDKRSCLIWSYLIGVFFIMILFIYIYFIVIRPFDKLSKFAREVSNGNFDSPLYYERKNLFGAFTWAFDNMRKEVKKARACEQEAVENNKMVIATISHDIKTPISSISAYAEGLQAHMDSNPERRERYISVILSKCEEVTKLTNDLFFHAISDLDKLRMNMQWCQSREVINHILDAIKVDQQRIHLLSEVPDLPVHIDVKRLEQVFENLVDNAMKYGNGSRIEISFESDEKYLRCHVRDYGQGIADADLPFIFNKFYRGSQVGNLPGSGLGLYIVKYIMEQMDGRIVIINHKDGIEAVIELLL